MDIDEYLPVLLKRAGGYLQDDQNAVFVIIDVSKLRSVFDTHFSRDNPIHRNV